MIKGFMGRTHALLSVMLLSILLLIPVEFLQQVFGLLKENVFFFVVGLIVLIGGALLPDLDNAKSCAGSTLGFMGSICTIFMQSTATIVYQLLHMRSDSQSPYFPHRYLWHSLIAGLGILGLFYFGMPDSSYTIIQVIKTIGFTEFFMNNTSMIFFIIALFMAVLAGSDMVFSKIIKFFKLPKLLSYIVPVAALVYMFFLDFTHLHILGILIGLGYVFHTIEDCFADSGCPLLFPLPIRHQMWHRVQLTPITIKTGSIANTLLDVAILIVDVILIALIFVGGGNFV